MTRRLKTISGGPQSGRASNPFQSIARQLGVSVTLVEKAAHRDKKAQQKLTDSQRGTLMNFVQGHRKEIDAYKRR